MKNTNQAFAKPRKRLPLKTSRRSKPSRPKLSKRSSATSGILDAVRDQDGGRWIRFGTEQEAVWFAVVDLISEPSAVFCRLAHVGEFHLTPASQSSFKCEIQEHSKFRNALVAKRSGWLEGLYVYGDGTIEAPKSDTREVIVAFETNPKFTPRGELKQWQREVGPFVGGQSIPFFAVGLALTGPIARVAPRGYLNPLAEIVGRGESGKTSVGAIAASVWAGNPESDCGGGELWDMTSNALDPIKLAHRDGFAFLDEGNLAGMTPKDQRDFMRRAVFKLATTGVKRRMGDPIQSEHARISLLSTTNTALAEILDNPADAQSAALSRMITLCIKADAPCGIFDFLPVGYSSARDSSEAMRAAADVCWGVVGRAFVKKLVLEIERDEEGLRTLVARGLAYYMSRDRAPPSSARIQKTFALVAVAIALAQRWSIIPTSWGSPIRLIRAAASRSRKAERQQEGKAHDKILDYVQRHRKVLVDVASLVKPLTAADFNRAHGFLRSGPSGRELLVPAARFQRVFLNHRDLVRSLRASGDARTEGGRKPKLSIKAPKAICHEGRVYCVRV